MKLTRDAQPIVIYDDLLDQTSNGSAAVVLGDLDVIRTLDAGS
ncbi:hypothetical protein ALQ57_04698 [Pseudomonas amygdali pv. hibisci]|uniref:GP-PDE domain-containing protein n=1 Tax=Pseudomonas amygdali pv. hibisci TaxID=251723 RepID=A0AB34UEP8_PSEA0|nr:hypothetical protein ALO67_05524 [Pseudomonas amygdali pv. hibisci]RMN60575.1 hypothetical protein ALQ57_04698 [Pseudomonas amygdali pv. hibisci]RMS56843.1 hypothetical protein ALP63_04989 [Pseudomonas syringae pv. aceris]RMS72355.1 hypothetical protein ALP62_05220 [Pseudomonas syringae pv. aceris]